MNHLEEGIRQIDAIRMKTTYMSRTWKVQIAKRKAHSASQSSSLYNSEVILGL
jgi:hypothetical protein